MHNPYSAEQHANPEVFRGYGDPPQPIRSPGGWTLQEITSCWLQLSGVAPSLWVVGPRKLGKTSLLLRLAYLLRAESQRPESPRVAVPLYLSCKGIGSLAAFYATLLTNAAELLAEGIDQLVVPFRLDLSQFKLLLSGTRRTDLDLLDLAAADLNCLVDQLALAGHLEARIVLLLDDVDAAGDWATPLFEHLRALLVGPPLPASGKPARRHGLVVALAGESGLLQRSGARSLLDLLDTVPLRSLELNEVAALTGPAQLDARWIFPVYRATAGHPWLVQFVMKHLVDSVGPDTQRYEQIFDEIIKVRFQEAPEGAEVFGHYLKHLQPHIQILAHLNLVREGLTLAALADTTGISATEVDEQVQSMLAYGVVYPQPGESGAAEGRYVLGDIFRHWFEAHTGATVLLAEIDRLRSAGKGVLPPFTLTLGLDPHLLLADGLYARLFELQKDLVDESLKLIDELVQNDGRKRTLELMAQNIKRMLRQTEWEPVWNDYRGTVTKAGGQPRFALRIGARRLFALPIEVLPFDGKALGLQAPVYGELLTEQRDTAYRLSVNPLEPDAPLNVLLVGSGSRGSLERRARNFPALEMVGQEVREVCELLLAAGPDQRLRIGKIVALVATADGLPGGVERHAPSAANLAKALSGELDATPFHLFHYCGHYIPNHDDDEGGFLLGDGPRLELFNLTAWQNALQAQTALRFACISACASAAHVEEPNLYHLGAAHTALSSGVPAVVGMRWSIRDADGYAFSREFYKHLLQSRVPEIALWKTRQKLAEADGASTLWAAPVMLTR